MKEADDADLHLAQRATKNNLSSYVELYMETSKLLFSLGGAGGLISKKYGGTCTYRLPSFCNLPCFVLT